MTRSLSLRLTTGIAALLALYTAPVPVSGHSWIERALKIDPISRKFFGAEGFPRGYVPRTDPAFNDEAVIHRLPYTGTAFYTGDETIAKWPINPDPSFDLLEAAPGDFVAILHFENGHTTKPETNPDKPLNRGTIYLYGTDQPRDDEKLFDVHLAWNRDGTGGDKRGRLLATRNYDDGQCYEARGDGLALERATTLGVDPMTGLACQSDLQLPDDLVPGTTYTIYWYWDWPNLNRDEIDMEATENGVFPWAGTFMRGEEDPNGFTMSAIATNESYASTLDIRVVDKETEAKAVPISGSSAGGLDGGGDAPTVFNMAIKEQLTDNFGVPVDGNPPAGDQPSAPPVESPPSIPTSNTPEVPVAPTNTVPVGDGQATVTVTVTQPPTTIATTIYITQLPDSPISSGDGDDGSSPSTDKPPCSTDPVQVITEVETRYTTVYPEGQPTSSGTTPPPAAAPTSESAPVLPPPPPPSSLPPPSPSPSSELPQNEVPPSQPTTPPGVAATLGFQTRIIPSTPLPIPPPSTPRWPNQTEQWSPQPDRLKRRNWWFGRG